MKQKPERVGLISRHLRIRFPGWLSGTDSTCQCSKHRKPGFYSWVGTSPGGGTDKPVPPAQYSCLKSPKDRGTWQATVHGVAKSWTWLSV